MRLGNPPKGAYLDTSRTLLCFPRWVRSFIHVINYTTNNITEGERSLPSMLGGGDLDGDIYAVMQYEPLLSVISWTPAE